MSVLGFVLSLKTTLRLETSRCLKSQIVLRKIGGVTITSKGLNSFYEPLVFMTPEKFEISSLT